jgi:hypothetical protein
MRERSRNGKTQHVAEICATGEAIGIETDTFLDRCRGGWRPSYTANPAVRLVRRGLLHLASLTISALVATGRGAVLS